MREGIEFWIALGISIVLLTAGIAGVCGMNSADAHRIDVLERRFDNLEKRELINQVEISKIREQLWDEDGQE